MPPAVIREVEVAEVTGAEDCGVVVVTRVVVGGVVVMGVVVVGVPEIGTVELGPVGVETVADELGTDDLLEWVREGSTTVSEALINDPVVTTDGLTVSGTRPVLVGSAPGADEQPDTTSTAPSIAPTVRLLNCVMNLPNPPAEQPPGCSYLTPEITRRARNLPELSTRSTRRTRDEARSTPDRVTR